MPVNADSKLSEENLSDDDFVSLIDADLRDEDRALASVIARLARVEKRSIHLRQGYASMFDFCTRRLRLSAGAAHRRLVAVRLVQRYPRLLNAIRDRKLHLAAIGMLRDLFNETNIEFLVEKASGKNQRELELLVARLRPRPDAPSRIRRFPEPADTTGAAAASQKAHGAFAITAALEASPGGGGPVENSICATPELPHPGPTPDVDTPRAADRPPLASVSGSREAAAAPASSGEPLSPSLPAAPPRRRLKRFEALSPGRNKVQFTVSDPLRERLEYALDLMSHANPSRDLAVVVDAALDLLLPALEKRRAIAPTRGAKTRTSKRPTYVDKATSHEVWARDGVQCTYIAPSGERCTGRAFLERDHVTPVALTATGTQASEVRVLCGAHNRFMAKELLGDEFVEAAKDFRQRKRAERSRERLKEGLHALAFDAEETEAALRIVEKTGWARPHASLMAQALATLQRGSPLVGPGPPR